MENFLVGRMVTDMNKKVGILKHFKRKKENAKSEINLNPYGLLSNLWFVLGEAWHFNKPLILVSAMLVFVETLQSVCDVVFSKYVVELVLVTENRIQNVIICGVVFLFISLTAMGSRAGNLYPQQPLNCRTSTKM